MKVIRHVLGYTLLTLALALGCITSSIIYIGAWLLDRESYEKQVREFLEQRDDEHPVPDYDEIKP